MKSGVPAPRRRAALALVAFVLILLIQAPAGLLTFALPPQIVLMNVQGSLWHGRASALGVGGMVVQERLAWDFRPGELLSGKLAWAIRGEFGGQPSQLSASLGFAGPALESVRVFLPLEPLAAMSPLLKSAQLGAEVRTNAESIRLRAPVTAQVTIERLSSPIAPQGELGHYRVELNMEADGQERWNLSTTERTLQIAGHGAFDVTAQIISGQLNLKMTNPQPGISPLLTQLPRSEDGYAISC